MLTPTRVTPRMDNEEFFGELSIRQLAEFRKKVEVALASCPELVDGLREPTVFISTDNSPKWQLMDNSPVLKCRGCKYCT